MPRKNSNSNHQLPTNVAQNSRVVRPNSAARQPESDWGANISNDEWVLYREAMQAVRQGGVPFMLGGGFAQATFTGRWRSTKDIDLYLLPAQRDAAVTALSNAGFADYYKKLPYDRRWIYRSTKDDVLVDIIWSMANQRAVVQRDWFDHAASLRIRGEVLQVLPREEFMWCKLYVLQRDRCDWIDIFNLLYSSGPDLDWDRLIRRLEDDWPLLQGVLAVYAWLHPERAALLPQSLRDKYGLSAPDPTKAGEWRRRVRLLDSRAWFSGLRARGEKLEI